MSARRDVTPDAHLFPTRPYDLVKEFVVALAVVGLLTVVLAAVFSSPDRKAITLQQWASAAPADVVATATSELAGTSGTATYGAPYNHNGPGQKLGPLSLQRWGGVRQPVDAANDLVIAPLQASDGQDPALRTAVSTWTAASAAVRTAWATRYGDALAAAPNGDPAKVAAGSYGPVPLLTSRLLNLARNGELEGLLTT